MGDSLVITFSEEMDTTAGTVTLTAGSNTTTPTAPVWSNGNKTVTYSYTGLANNTAYTVNISGFKDAVGNVMVADSANTFTTKKIAVTLNSVTANGSATQTTTQLTFTFDKAITGLTAGDITITDTNSTGITKGALTTSDSTTYTLAVSGITKAGNIAVAVNAPDGYTLSGSPKTGIAIHVDTTKPTVATVTPTGTGAAVGDSLVITFSEEMDTTAGAVTLTAGSNTTTPTAPVWTNGNKTVTYSYTGLAYNTVYTVNISGFKDIVGNVMAADSANTFTTEKIAVALNSVTANGSAAQTTTQLTLTFNKAITGLTVGDITITDTNSTGITKGVLTTSDSTTYTLTVSGITKAGKIDVAVNTPAGYTLSGSPKTGIDIHLDTTKPTVATVTPTGTDAAVGDSLVITFSEEMDTTAGAVTLTEGSNTTTPTAPVWSNGNKTVTYSYTGLANNTAYTVNISGFKDIVGNVMAADSANTFTTKKIAVALNSVTANGSAAQTTTQLTLTFNKAITGLTVGDITITDTNSTGITKGVLTTSDSTTYTLTVSGITKAGKIDVAVNAPAGYTLSGSPKTGIDIRVDSTLPAFSGIEDGKNYCEKAEFTVIEEDLDTVKVNGTAINPSSGKYTLTTPGTKSIVATDKAGNVKSVVITIFASHSWDDGVVTTAPTAAKEGVMTYTCAHCGETKTASIAKLLPTIIAGNGGSFTQGGNTGLTFKSDAALSDLVSVSVDGNVIGTDKYTTGEGSTIVTLKADYLATLSVGKHTLDIKSASGTASANFTIAAKAADTTNTTVTSNPNTGDNSNMLLWVALLFISGGATLTLAVTSKKRRQHNED